MRQVYALHLESKNKPKSLTRASKSFGLLCFSLLIIFSLGSLVFAEDRSQKLNFEDNLVEGLNKKPLDSLSSINEKRKNGNSHLYQRKPNFDAENKTTVLEAGFVQ